MRDGLTGDIARRAFDAVAAAQDAASVADLDRILKPTFSRLGFDVFVGVDAVNARGQRDVHILFGQTHAEWEAHYHASGHATNDAIIREMLASAEPLFWSDLNNRRLISLEELNVLNEAREFRLRNGFMVPLHNVDGSISAVLLMGEHVDPRDPDTRAAAHLLSTFYGSVGRRLRRDALGIGLPPVALSNRQRECLRWVRDGKSSTDIGDILGVSGRTVDDYIATACKKLGVRTRTQAVVEAARHGLIAL